MFSVRLGETMRANQHKGELYAILSGFLYGFIGYFGVHVLKEGFSISSMQFWRFFIAVVLISPLAIREIILYKPAFKEMFYSFLGGVLFYGLSTYLYFLASEYLGTGLAMVVFFTFPVFVMVMNIIFFKFKIHPISYVAILVILIGMNFLIDSNEVKMDLKGVILGLLSSISFAGFMVTCGHRKLTSNVFTLMVSLGCGVTGLIVCIAQQQLQVPTALNSLWPMLGISVIATLAPIILLQKSMHFISSQKAALLSVLEPVFVVIFGVYLLDEHMTLRHFLGVFIILSGALLALFDESKATLRD